MLNVKMCYHVRGFPEVFKKITNESCSNICLDIRKMLTVF